MNMFIARLNTNGLRAICMVPQIGQVIIGAACIAASIFGGNFDKNPSTSTYTGNDMFLLLASTVLFFVSSFASYKTYKSMN